MNLKHFRLREFTCSCGCGQNHMDPTFLQMLDEARARAGIPFVINSGYRCEAHNRAVGSTSSNHTRGVAADIRCEYGPMRLEILKALLAVGFERIGIHRTFIHTDINAGPKSVWLY
jgi:uncharacterized protein YcbK (DUF882 family)